MLREYLFKRSLDKYFVKGGTKGVASKSFDCISLNSIKSVFSVYRIASLDRTVGQLVLQSGRLVHMRSVRGHTDFAGEKIHKWFAITTFPPLNVMYRLKRYMKLILGLCVLKQQRGDLKCLVGN